MGLYRSSEDYALRTECLGESEERTVQRFLDAGDYAGLDMILKWTQEILQNSVHSFLIDVRIRHDILEAINLRLNYQPLYLFNFEAKSSIANGTNWSTSDDAISLTK